MRKHILLIFLILISLHLSNWAQVSFKAQAGISYIEHFSIGATISFSEKHNISLLFGSNFFVKPQDFASYMLQYDFLVKKLEFAGFIPKLGFKGGYSIYSDDNYKWTLMVFVPFVGLNYPVNKKLAAGLEVGLAGSREISLTRISYGDAGKYRNYLPECKIVMLYNL